MLGLDPLTIEVVKILTDVAGKIGAIILSQRKGSIEKDKEDFYNRVKKYHERTTEITRKGKGSPKRLAQDIAKDKLFTFLAGYDNAEQIYRALMYVDELPRRKRYDRKEVLRALLKVLESITITSFS